MCVGLALIFEIRYGGRLGVKRVSEKVACAYKHFEIGIGEVQSFTMASFNPTQIFQSDVTEEKGENARLSAFVGAIAVGDLVKSTLGPKGMDKILQSAYVDSYIM